MKNTLGELSLQFGFSFSGKDDFEITHSCNVDNPTPGGICYISNPSELSNLQTPEGVFNSQKKGLTTLHAERGCVIIVPKGTEYPGATLIYADDPLQLHANISVTLYPPPTSTSLIDQNTSIGENVQIGDRVSIYPGVVLYDNVILGDRVVLHAGVVIMNDTVLGSDCVIFPNVTIREGCIIGDGVIIHSGSVIGADGFGFYQREGKNLKIPQIGNVIIENNVEIGACTTIDRARFDHTVIGEGSKLDNLVHIAHNVKLGKQCLLTAQSGIAGSVTTGDELMMGGQSGIRDNLKIGHSVKLLARTLVTSKMDDNAVVGGMPARPIEKWRQIQAMINSLDSMFERLRSIETFLRKMGFGKKGK